MTEDGLGEDVVASDLFFSLAAMLIVVLCLMSQSLRAVVANPAPGDAALSQAAVKSGKFLALARQDGATLTAPDGSVLRLGMADILSDRAELWARAAGPGLWQVIATDARDSAFLMDTMLARAGLAEVQRIRLDRPCPRPRVAAIGLVCDG